MSSTLQFAYSILYVKDVPATVTFYSNAFELSCRFTAPDDSYAEMETGGTVLAFAQHELASQNIPAGYTAVSKSAKPFGFEIAFTTEDIESALQKATKAGAELLCPIKEKPWGQKVAYVLDLNGFIIELCTAMS